MALEIERRRVGGVWRTGVVDDPGGGGGLPAGGSTGEVLTKASNADGDADWEPNGGSQPVYVARVRLNDAEIKAIPSAAVELVESPGADKLLWPLDVVFYADTTEAAYGGFQEGGELGVGLGFPGDFLSYFGYTNIASTVGAPDALLGYGGIVIGASTPTQFQNDLVDTRTVSLTYGGAEWADKPLSLYAVNDTDYTDGDPANFMVVAVRYSIIDLAP